LQALFEPGHPQVKRVVRLVCRNGLLVLKFETSRGLKAADANPLAAQLAPAVVAMAQRLAAAHPGEAPPDGLWWRAALVLAIGTGLLAHGLLDAFRVGLDFDVRTLDVAQLWLVAAVVAAAAVGALAVLGVVLLGRSSRAHLVLVEALLLAVAGAPLGAMAEVRDLNIEADRSAPETFVVQVTGKYVRKGNKGGRTYVVALTGWPARPDGYELKVRGDDFDLYLVNADVTLVQRGGYLHIRWLQSAAPEPP